LLLGLLLDVRFYEVMLHRIHRERVICPPHGSQF
jgi:hypothetical protein